MSCTAQIEKKRTTNNCLPLLLRQQKFVDQADEARDFYTAERELIVLVA